MIDNAAEIEAREWSDFEANFRRFHESSLSYRLLPATEAEREIVVQEFPAIAVDGKSGRLSMDYQCLTFTDWPAPIEFREITNCTVDNGVLLIQFQRNGKQKQKLKLKTFGNQQQGVLDAINRYWGRYQSAAAYQAKKRLAEAAGGPPPL